MKSAVRLQKYFILCPCLLVLSIPGSVVVAGILSRDRKVRQHSILLAINCHTVGKKENYKEIINFK
jgi:hypothetical protein